MKITKRGLIACIAYLAILFFPSCKPTKSVSKTEVQKSDTVIIKTEAIRAPVLHDLLTIEEICQDSVVRPLERILVRDTDTIRISTVDNSLSVQISQQARTLSERELIIQKQSERISELQQTVKTRTSIRTVLILIGVLVLFVVFPGIPYHTHQLIKRLIRGLLPV